MFKVEYRNGNDDWKLYSQDSLSNEQADDLISEAKTFDRKHELDDRDYRKVDAK